MVGFSLIEILVVLMIIGILTALIVVAMGRLLGNAQIEATRVTIAQIDEVIQARYEAVRNADVKVEAKKLASLNSSINENEAEFLIRKELYRQALPQRPEDLHGLDRDDSTTNDNATFYSAYTTQGGTANSDDESVTAAEVFMFAITNGDKVRALPGGKTYSVPVLELDKINRNHIADIDNDGLSELVDEWGQPFRFYNFPTRLIRDASTIDISNARFLITGLPGDTSDNGPLGQDPLDPTGILSGEFSNDSNLTHAPGKTLNRKKFDEENYHTANTYYVPLLVSVGPDGSISGSAGLGLGEPTSTTVDSGPPVVAERLAQIIDQDPGTNGIQLMNPDTNENPLLDNLTNSQ